METLRLVDVTDQGHLVLMSGDGRRFELPVDAEIRSAVRRDRTAPPPPRGERPGPREVQARIRAGADAESVADATGLELSYVRRFEGPALAERQHVADLARLSQVHRDLGARHVTLEAAVHASLTDTGVDARDLTWDSRRVEGSRWDVVVLVPAPAGRPAAALEATWRFDVATRSLEEIDEAARRLTRLEQRKLSPVRERVFDIEAGRAATVKARRAAAGSSPQTSSTAALLESLAQQRGRRPQSVVGRTAGLDPVPAGDPPDGDGDADASVTPVPIGSAAGRLRSGSSGPTTPRRGGEQPGGGSRDPVRTIQAGSPDLSAPAPDPPDVDVAGAGAAGPQDLGAPDGTGSDASGSGGGGSDLPAPPHPEPVPGGRRPAGTRRAPAARPPRAVPRTPVPAPEAARRATEAPSPGGVGEPARTRRASSSGSTQLAIDPLVGGADAAPAVRGSRKRRAGVPSWDDIVFGARPDGEE